MPVVAQLMMMCGCPIEPGGPWDANQYEVTITVTRGGETSEPITLDYAGQPSRFAARVPVSDSGLYRVTVRAYDSHNSNTGIDRTTFVVR